MNYPGCKVQEVCLGCDKPEVDKASNYSRYYTLAYCRNQNIRLWGPNVWRSDNCISALIWLFVWKYKVVKLDKSVLWSIHVSLIMRQVSFKTVQSYNAIYNPKSLTERTYNNKQ